MQPQVIRDSNNNRVQLFATRAKQTVISDSGYKFTIMRPELRSALLQEDSAKSAWSDNDATHYVQLWAKAEKKDHHGECIGVSFQGPETFARVPVKFYLPVKNDGKLISLAVLRIGCTTFEGSHARAFYKWAISKSATKGGKR